MLFCFLKLRENVKDGYFISNQLLSDLHVIKDIALSLAEVFSFKA